MAKREGIGVPDLQRQLASGAPAPIYLVVGEQAFLRGAAVAAIRQAVLGQEADSAAVFNDDLVYGDETHAQDILNRCDSLPVFATRRLVVVRDINRLGSRETERLQPYLKTPVETTCLVLTGDKVDGRLKFFQSLKAAAVTVDCGSLDQRALPLWIREQAAALGLQLNDVACDALQEAGGGELAVMRRELEKLAAYVAPGTAVTAADVEAVQGRDAGGTVQDLITALSRKDRGGALKALAKVLDAGERPLQLLGLIAWNWRQVWKTREQLGRRVPEAGLARVLGVPPFRVSGLVQQARLFSDVDMERSFEAFRVTDSRLKGEGRGKEKFVMERLILALCRGEERVTSTRASAPAR
jgi:DNA polymerase-3 subunit delta